MISSSSRTVSQKSGQPAAGADSAVSSLPVQQFVWGAGMECSFLPHMKVDQFEWTQHDRFWKEDLRRAREEAGITTMRYAFPWHFLEPSPGKFEWDYADERMAEFDKLGINAADGRDALRYADFPEASGGRSGVSRST